MNGRKGCCGVACQHDDKHEDKEDEAELFFLLVLLLGSHGVLWFVSLVSRRKSICETGSRLHSRDARPETWFLYAKR